MAPPEDFKTDFYGYREYIGKDSYGYFNPSVESNNAREPLNYLSRINTTSNPDYILPDQPEYKPKNGYVQPKPYSHELESPPTNYVSKYRHEREELHFNTTICELSAHDFEGSSISTEVDYKTWKRRQDFAREFVKNFDFNYEKPKHGMISKLSLGIKTVNNTIVFIYIKCQEIGRRKVLWNIWEKNRGKYESYKHFKRSWDNDKSIWNKIEKDIRDDIKTEVEDLLGIKKIKKDLRKSVKAEVERLLREKQPFKH